MSAILGIIILISCLKEAGQTEVERKHELFVAEVGPEVAPIYDELQMLFWKARAESRRSFSDGLPSILRKRDELRRKLAQMDIGKKKELSISLLCLGDPQWVWGFNKKTEACFPAVKEGGYYKPVPGYDPMYDMIYRYEKK